MRMVSRKGPFLRRQTGYDHAPNRDDEAMNHYHSSCAECQAIYKDLLAARVATEQRQGGEATPQALAEWLEALNEEECAQTREASSLWAVQRGLQEHRTFTGHHLSALPLPPRANSNPN